MARTVYYYAELTQPQLLALDGEHTLAVMALSPLETHGPHLPLGTDVFLAEAVRDRAIEKMQAERPDLDYLVFPSVALGGDPIPAPGSIKIDSRAIHLLLVSTAASLAGMDFKWMLVTDNHGGARHQAAIEKAVRKAWKKHHFAIICPFLNFYRRMVEHDPDLLEATGTAPGSCGDIDDSHAGTNETSLMLAAAPDKVADNWKDVPKVTIDRESRIYRRLSLLGTMLSLFGVNLLGRDLGYMGAGLAWQSADPMPPYMGAPGEANPERGRRMLEAHADEAVAQVRRALDGEPPFSTPMLWSLRFAERS